MKRVLLSVMVAGMVLVRAPSFAGPETGVPHGFEAPGLLDRIMKGEVVLDETVATPTEFEDISRAYFNKVSADAYIALAINHPHYADLFEEVQEAKTTKVSDDKTQYDWWLNLLVSVGPFSRHVYPEGRQTIARACDAVSESRIDNEITNYKDYLASASQKTRLIPYQGGILIEDDVHFQLRKASSFTGMIKSKMKEFFGKYVETFRKELHGEY